MHGTTHLSFVVFSCNAGQCCISANQFKHELFLQSNSSCHCLWLSNGIWSNHKGQLTGWYKKWIFFLLLTHQCKAPCCNVENLLCKKNTPSFSTWLQIRRFWLGFIVHFKKKYSYKIAQSKLDLGLCHIVLF